MSFCLCTKNMSIILSKRLSAAAVCIRRGAVLADIGTDHAYLPIYAVASGAAARAIAADINKKPLDCAAANIEKYALSDKIECVLTSGFKGLDGYGITDAVIAGMGGELIASIVTDADFIRHLGFRLIIQPMTMPDAARRALFACGFSVTDEYTLAEDGKLYTVICADYTGKVLSDADEFMLLYGELAARKFENDAVRREYFAREAAKYRRIINGRASAALSSDSEKMLLDKLIETENKTK